MDKQKAKILHNLLKSSSTDKACRGLREIKKRLLTSPDNLSVFRTLGLIPQTLKLIQRPNEEILNGALSILSCCCSDEDARREVFRAGGVTHILNVLKCAKLEPLQLRACRTLANQAQHNPSCEVLVRLHAVELVIEVLEGCQEEETKVAGIRALRLFANCGEHCQKIVTCKGILRICAAGFGTPSMPSSPNLMRATVKAIAHFSRISHPTCISQIMEGTDNMLLVSKMWDNADQEIYECVLRTILNTVHSCFAPSPHKRYALDARVLDRLCTATAPTIIVAELQNRRVTSIEEEKLVLALCKFCEGSITCNNLPYDSFEVSTSFGRVWMQLVNCGGVALLVHLLLAHRNHSKLRPALLRAILGVEQSFSYRDTVLKHMLAAKLLPQLAEQFDELMAKYVEVRRDPLPGKCIHTLQTGEKVGAGREGRVGGGDSGSGTGGEGSGGGDSGSGTGGEGSGGGGGEGMGKEVENILKENNTPRNKMELEGEEEDRQGRAKQDAAALQEDKPYGLRKAPAAPPHPIKDAGQITKDLCPRLPLYNPLSAFSEIRGFDNHTSPTSVSHPNPRSPDSVSCSPRSYQSSSGYDSPTWSPPATRSESPTLSSPPFIGSSHTSLVSTSLPLWNVEAFHTSPTSSPPHSPTMSSPLPSSSPIRVPSDWEYEDEDERNTNDDGRFSPTVESKLSEMEDSQEELDEDEDMSVEEETEGGLEALTELKETEIAVSDLQNSSGSTALEKSMKASPLSPSTEKRGRESPATPQEKKIKLNPETGETTEEGIRYASFKPSSPLKEAATREADVGGHDEKSPFVKLNQIKFRVRKKGLVRRQLSLVPGEGVYTPLQEQQKTEDESDARLRQQQQQQQQNRPGRGRSDSICSSTVYSDLSTGEAQCLGLLELVVRLIGQVAHVKEAIKPVCREFVPRIMTYLSKAQVIHKSATRMLVTIARNPQCIQPLLDSLFIPYVGVELGEAGDPESPSGCPQCKILSEGASAFLDQMVNFFNHTHLYGKYEVTIRLHPSREPAVREGCVMALPHITRCPKLLYDFMVYYPAIDLLMSILHSSQPPDQASYMYATAGLSRLASTLRLEKRYKLVCCEVCYRRESHSKEEVTAQLKCNNNMRCDQSQAPHTATHTSVHTPTATPATPKDEGKECHWLKDKEVQDVTFTLKDGSSVSANREYLADKNEVLRGMLQGSFSEGSSPSVDLPWSRKESIEMLIHFLHRCRSCTCMESGDMEVYIELVLISQMYLVDGLQAYAESHMLSAIRKWEDIIQIFESGVGQINENLILQAICTALVKPMKTWKRARWIKGLFQSPHAQDIDHNIHMILHHPLDINRLVCNCNQYLYRTK